MTSDRRASGFCSAHQYPHPGERDYTPDCTVCYPLTSNQKLDALIRRVNALIPNSVKPSTRIEIHPCDWITLVAEIEDLRKRPAVSTACAHPVEHLYYHGFVSGNIGDFRCTLCNTVLNRKELDPREVAAQRIERSAVEPFARNCIHGRIRAECLDCTPENGSEEQT